MRTRKTGSNAIPRKKHLRIEHYVQAGTHSCGAAELARRAHEHVFECCPVCADEWRRLGRLQPAYLDHLLDLETSAEPADPPQRYLSGQAPALESEEQATQRLLRMRRRALEDKCELLLRTPPEERVRKIRRARSRFRSFLLAEMLIEECRRRVRNDPKEALAIVELVPHVLAWSLDHAAPPHAGDLLARAAAHRANALRVAGDLPAAEQEFIALRHRLAHRPLADPLAAAEIASLEASLCIGQRRFPEADELLAQATLSARHAGDADTLARIHIKRANLMQARGRPAEIAPLLAVAASLIDAAADPYLFLCTVTGRVNALCDLDRAGEARRLLLKHADAYESSDDPFAGATFRCLLGRCALGMGEATEAEETLTASRDACLALGRAYDAALVALYLTEALLLAGKTREVRRLATQLVAFFRSRGVKGEALAALQQLTRATASEAVTVGLFAEIRRLAAAGSVPTHSD